MPKDSRGFHLVALGFAITAIIGIGVVSFSVYKHQGQKNAGPAKWTYNEQAKTWQHIGGTPPVCPNPLKLEHSPVDTSKVIAVGMPGAYRGYNYKAHGGLRLADSTEGKTDIVLPIDATLKSIRRYYEAIPGQTDELQYLLTFENECGIAIRYDHLHTLTPELQAAAEKTAPPKKNDTRSDPNEKPINLPIKSGEVIATQVGFPEAKNYGFDFGVYDYRQPNEISKNDTWAAIHASTSSLDYHGVCWLQLLPGIDAARAQAMTLDKSTYKTNKPFMPTSDYCNFAPYKTLDFNGGQPTEG